MGHKIKHGLGVKGVAQWEVSGAVRHRVRHNTRQGMVRHGMGQGVRHRVGHAVGHSRRNRCGRKDLRLLLPGCKQRRGRGLMRLTGGIDECNDHQQGHECGANADGHCSDGSPL